MTRAVSDQAVEWMSAADAAWFRMERTRSPADVVALIAFEGQVDEARLREVVESGLMSRRRFHQRVVDSERRVVPPHWENEPEPRLSDHLLLHRLEAPSGDRELVALVNALTNQPFDFTRSPWRMWLIEGYAAGSVLLVQLHHCMGDGFALLDILLSLAEGSPMRPARAPAVGRAQRGLFGLAHLLRRIPKDLAHLAFLSFDPHTRLRGATSGERRLAWSSDIELARVRRLARAQSATINDVVMAVLAGALRAYLSERGDQPETLRALVPVNLRPASTAIDDTRGNWFGLLFVALPLAEPERTRRLRLVRRDLERIKASEEAGVSLGILRLLGVVPGLLERAIEQLFSRKGSLVVSNVPGPREPLRLAGQRVRDMLFWAPHPSGLACGVSILSYAGKLRVGVRSDARVIADPQRIAELFEEELRAFEHAHQTPATLQL